MVTIKHHYKTCKKYCFNNKDKIEINKEHKCTIKWNGD